jgi:7,8-dihydropterin-6-yl-methyl-4-(beta-D-ribofuranosyl)aminobenzene 5'-phosphate synthase
MKKLLLFLFIVIPGFQIFAQQQHIVGNLKVTILSTMMTQQSGTGEWGFSALVEADSIKILFDAGGRETTVLNNTREMKIDLSVVPTLILSHNHDDHTSGWLPLRRSLSSINQQALSVTHVAPGFFDTRFLKDGKEEHDRQADSVLYVQTNGKIIEHKSFTEIFPGIYLTGNVPRTYAEKNYGAGLKRDNATGKTIEDNIPEDMSLVIRTRDGLVLLSGCGHSGIINTIKHVRDNLQQEPVYAAIGGFHLFANADDQIKWTSSELKKAGIRYFMGAHCTGIEPVYQIREWAGLKRGECVVGSIGAIFQAGKGFQSGPLTK